MSHVHICPVTHARWLDNPLRRLLHKPEKVFASLISEGQTAIDIGCGPGYFSIGMARMVGENGKVIAIDLQPEMLEMVKHNAAKHGLQSRIITYQCSADSLNLTDPSGAGPLNGKADFVLAFWMVHEVDDQAAFFQQVVALLKPGARFLLVEPKFHVGLAAFKKTVEIAKSVGLKAEREMKIRISRAMLLTRADS